MPINWKSGGTRLQPSVILGKLDSVVSLEEDGRVNWGDGFFYFDAIVALRSMIKFPDNYADLDKIQIIKTALKKAAQNNVLTPIGVLESVRSTANDEIAKPDVSYRILTSISASKPFPTPTIRHRGCQISITGGSHPKKYVGRRELIEDEPNFTDLTPDNYAKVVICLKAKGHNSAFSKAFKVLDTWRGCWNLFANYTGEIIGTSWKPINRIRTGHTHTLHYENGQLASKIFKYDPNFEKTNTISIPKNDVLAKNIRWMMQRIAECSYSNALTDAIVRYARAFDERDPNIALIKMWGALEALCARNQNNHELVARRAASIFQDYDYHFQIIQHLREYRNQSIHAGDQEDEAKTHCYQLQRYFYHLILFHVHNVADFGSLEDANSFLDLPRDLAQLQKREKFINKAIRFRTPKEPPT